jgi:zinc resistance-associated protein
MKKIITLSGISLLVLALAIPALAWWPSWGRGHHMMGYDEDRGPGYCQQYGREDSELSRGQWNKTGNFDQEYYNETADLRNKLWEKSTELSNLLNSSDPDVKKAKEIQKEINDLGAQLDEKRLTYEIEGRKTVPEGRFGMGYGRGMGYGPHMRGYGPGACWN